MRETRYHEIVLEKPAIRIGKKGASDLLVREIAKRLEKREVVKVKVLKTALISEEVDGIAQKVAKETDSEVIHLRGHTFTLYRSKRD